MVPGSEAVGKVNIEAAVGGCSSVDFGEPTATSHVVVVEAAGEVAIEAESWEARSLRPESSGEEAREFSPSVESVSAGRAKGGSRVCGEQARAARGGGGRHARCRISASPPRSCRPLRLLAFQPRGEGTHAPQRNGERMSGPTHQRPIPGGDQPRSCTSECPLRLRTYRAVGPVCQRPLAATPRQEEQA